ncbi:MAG: hypothetical protein ACOY94_06030 [Bacillota bacterium]
MPKYQLDPDAPATRHLLQVMAEIRQRYAATHTSEECRALPERAAENRRIRQMMVNKPRPVFGPKPGKPDT